MQNGVAENKNGKVRGSHSLKLKEGSGFWIHKSRVYYNIGETCNEIRKRQFDLSIEQVLQPYILKWDDTTTTNIYGCNYYDCS